jgi:proline dehydrogenase
MSLVDRAIVRTLPHVPRSVVGRVAARYIAGERLEDGVAAVRRLNAEGKLATLDLLGEEVANPEETRQYTELNIGVLETIAREGVDANLSVKPTALGLEIGPDVCGANLRRLLDAAREHGTFVRLDMEDSSTTDATLAAYRSLRSDGYDGAGVVLQAMLHRTHDDAVALAPLRPNVRVCKGIYVEPEEAAFQRRDEIRASFILTVEALLDAGAYVAAATHDELLLQETVRLVRERGLSRDEYELQMLLGVRPDLATRLVRQGHRVRIYVPFGRRWYEYSLRRLQENPHMATQVALGLFRLPGR